MDSPVDHSDTSRRRGRPQRLPEDLSPFESDQVGINQRVSWLLATSRVLNIDSSFADRKQFLEHLRTQGLAVDSSRISRWESGEQRVRDDVIEAYERVLGLPDSSLAALSANLRRPRRDAHKAQNLEHDQSVLDRLHERAVHGTMTGSDWLNLSSRFFGLERLYLPPQTRMTLGGRLLKELQVAVGHAQITRVAAANLAMSSPLARPSMSRILGTLILSANAQMFRPALLLLRTVDDHAVDALMLRLMADERPLLASAASSVVAMKLSDNRFTKQSLATVERHILDGINAPICGPRVLDALDLVSRVPGDAFDRVRSHISHPQHQRVIHMVRESGELQSPELARDVVRDLARQVQAAVPSPPGQEPDQLLARLLRETLFHVRTQRRVHAAQLLGASPYRSATAASLLELTGVDDAFVAERSWDALEQIGPEPGIDPASIVLDESRPGPQTRGLMALGAVTAHLDASHAQAIGQLAWRGTPDVQRAATTALGMTGSSELHQLLTHPSATLRAAAAWWIGTGPAVTDHGRI